MEVLIWTVGYTRVNVAHAPPSVTIAALVTGNIMVDKLNEALELGDLCNLVGACGFYFTC